MTVIRGYTLPYTRYPTCMSPTVTFWTAGFTFFVVPVCACFFVPQPENDTNERSITMRIVKLTTFFINAPFRHLFSFYSSDISLPPHISRPDILTRHCPMSQSVVS